MSCVEQKNFTWQPCGASALVRQRCWVASMPKLRPVVSHQRPIPHGRGDADGPPTSKTVGEEGWAGSPDHRPLRGKGQCVYSRAALYAKAAGDCTTPYGATILTNVQYRGYPTDVSTSCQPTTLQRSTSKRANTSQSRAPAASGPSRHIMTGISMQESASSHGSTSTSVHDATRSGHVCPLQCHGCPRTSSENHHPSLFQ